jgi:DNA-binding NtrC family response regulator
MDSNAPHRILVVDDEEVFRNLLQKTLRLEGYVVDTASDGLDAIELINRQHYLVILSDIMMPRADGIEVLRAARRVDPQAAVILVTGYASLDTALAAIKEGAYDYITKPFQLEEIRLTVANAAEKRRLVQENHRLMENLKSAYQQIKTLMESRSQVTRALEDIDDELERRQREIYEGMQALRNAAGARPAGTPVPPREREGSSSADKVKNAVEKFQDGMKGEDLETIRKKIFKSSERK